MVSGKIIDSNEAYRIGLINSIFDQDKLINQVMEIAMKINQNSSNAIAKTLSSVFSGNIGIDYENEAELFKQSFKHNDSKVGLSAFLNKSKPIF